MPLFSFLFGYCSLLVIVWLHSLSITAQFTDEDPYEVVSVDVSQPTNNSPLDPSLVYYRLQGYNGDSDTLRHGFVTVSCGANVSVHYTDPDVFPDAGTSERPILLLNHGYPQSSYIWRYISPEISKRVPVVIPDRPGYGLSTVCPNGIDMRTNAGALIDTVVQLYGKDKTVILAGHDRGGRSMQLAAVDIGLGRIPADQGGRTLNSRHRANHHRGFLPRVQDDFSLDVIMAYGGGNWASYINRIGSGINETAIDLFKAGKAFEIYKNFFDQVSVTNASIWDYYDASRSDYQEMKADQAAGRKIKMPTHIEYSHFIIEQAPQQIISQLNQFLDRLGVKSVSGRHRLDNHDDQYREHEDL